MSIPIFLVLHILIAVCLIALILVQQGKGAAMGAALGGGASGTVFGSRGSRGFLYKLTGGFALAFFATSIALTYFSAQSVSRAHAEASSLGLNFEEPESNQNDHSAEQAPIKPMA